MLPGAANDFQRILAGPEEGDDPGPVVLIPGAGDRGAPRAQPVDQVIGQRLDARLDGVDAHLLEQGQAGAQPQNAGQVVGSAFQAAGVGLEAEVDLGVVEQIDHALPADGGGPDLVELVLADVENGRPFRGDQPLVAVGGEVIDLGGFDVHG